MENLYHFKTSEGLEVYIYALFLLVEHKCYAKSAKYAVERPPEIRLLLEVFLKFEFYVLIGG